MTGEENAVNALGAPDGRSSRWASHRERRRDELTDAAIEAIRRYGADVGMDAVAAVAGVSKPVLYRYFADKSQLWLAVGQKVTAGLVATVAPAVAAVREDRAIISTAIDVYLERIAADPQVYRFVVHQPGLPHVRDVVADTKDTIAGGLARVIGDRLRAMGLDAGPALPWAHGLVGCVQAVGDWWLGQQQPISREALTEYLTTLLWNGIAGVRASADLPLSLEVTR